MRHRAAKIPARSKKYLTEALEQLVQLYDAWGKPEQAKVWRQKLEQAKLAPEHPTKWSRTNRDALHEVGTVDRCRNQNRVDHATNRKLLLCNAPTLFRPPLDDLRDLPMQNSAWIALLRLIPPAQQENIVLTTSNNTDIAVQSVIRAEKDFLVLRGRLTGTTEGGGFFFLPYDQIVYLGFQRPWKEVEVRAMFGETEPSPAAAEAALAAEAAEVPLPAEEPASGLEAIPAASTPEANETRGNGSPAPQTSRGSSPKVRAGIPNKAALLEKLRSRRSEGGLPSPSP